MPSWAAATHCGQVWLRHALQVLLSEVGHIHLDDVLRPLAFQSRVWHQIVCGERMPTELDGIRLGSTESAVTMSSDDAYRGRALILERPTKALREQLSSSWGSSAAPPSLMIRPYTLGGRCLHCLTVSARLHQGEDLDR